MENHGSRASRIGGWSADGVIGWVKGESAGPLLLCVGGLHGNEPAGVRALEKLVRLVEARRRLLRGDFVAVAGNLAALAAGRRFMSRDLNRAWTPYRIAAARARMRSGDGTGAPAAPEDGELVRMLGVLDAVESRRRGPVWFLDLHTTSGGGGAFTTSADEAVHRRFAMSIPAPLVLGLDEHLEGTLNGYMTRLGYPTALVECGQHEEAKSRDRAASAVWLAIRAAGLLEDADAPEARAGHRELAEEYRHLPRILEVKHRHPVTEEDGYATRPGFLNFQPVSAGDIIGDDRRGEVAAPKSGRILMPLYQELGEDGFFVVRDVGAAGSARRERELAGVGAGGWSPRGGSRGR